MLRLLVLLLLLANSLYFGWANGYFSALGLTPDPQSEPYRLQTQIKPEAIALLSRAQSAAFDSATPDGGANPSCLQSGLMDTAQASSIKAVLAPLPAQSYSLIEVTEPARWIVYMGKYANADAVNAKKAEVRRLKVAYEDLQNASLEPGFSIGAYPTQAQANESLTLLVRRGVRTARVVQELPARSGFILKLTQVNNEMQAYLPNIQAALGTPSLSACK